MPWRSPRSRACSSSTSCRRKAAWTTIGGTYSTPAAVVRGIVRAGLTAIVVHRFDPAPIAAERWMHDGEPPAGPRPDLRRVAVLDPAVGSGAFLLGALEELTHLRCAAGEGPTATV